MVAAQPIQERDPYDPVEIVRILPEKYHKLFFAEYSRLFGRSEQAKMIDQLAGCFNY
jgi:hypothetical protein